MKITYLLASVLLVISLSSCGGDEFDCNILELNIGSSCDDGNSNTIDDEVTSACTCVGTEITYTNTIKAIIDGSCAVSGCHVTAANAGGFDLESYPNVHNSARFGNMIGAIKRESGFSPMPPPSPLDATSVSQIEAWAANGAPE